MKRTKNLGAFEFPQGPKADHRDGGKLSLMVRAGGYCMVRRPHCVPFVVHEQDWAKLADWKKPDPEAVAFSPTGPNSTCM